MLLLFYTRLFLVVFQGQEMLYKDRGSQSEKQVPQNTIKSIQKYAITGEQV
tara:strand:+ start:98 stop:250 length:153 start_codon:yes stop_codon:yes gene_type:complete